MASLETTEVQHEAPSDSFVEISEMEEAKELSHRATGDKGQEPLQESTANEKIEVSQESPWSFVDISESGECKEPDECATKAEMLPYRGPGESNETTSSFMVISECGETKNASPETKCEAENETTSERGNMAFLNSTNGFVDLSESEEMREPLKESTREDELDASEKATSDQVHALYKQRTDSFAIFCEFEDNINLIPEATHEDLLQEATSEDASQEPTSNIYKERKDQTEGVVFQNQQKSQCKGPEDGTELPHLVMCDFAGASMESEAQLQVLTREAHWSEYEATTVQRKEMSQETIYTFTDITSESKTTAEQLEVFTSPTHEPHHEASALLQLQYEATMKEYKGKNKVQPKKVTVEQLHKSPKEVTTDEDIDLTHESTCTCNDVTTNIERNNEPEQTMDALMAAGLNVFPKATMALQLASDCKKGKEQVKENICQDEYRSTLAVTMKRGADMTNKQYCTAGTNFESRKETHQNVTGEIPNQNIINPTNEDRNKLSEWEAIAVQLNVSEWPQEDTNKKVKRQPDLGNTHEKPKKKKANAKGSDPLGETEESHPGTAEGTNKEQHEELARLIVWDELKGKLQYLAQEENKKEPTRRKVQVTESDKEVAQSEAQGGPAGSTGPFYYGWSGNAQLLAPAETLWTVQRDGAVRLRMESSGAGSEPALTVAQLMADAVRWFGQQVALCVREAEEWQRITYLQYGKQCRAVSKGLIRIGLERFHGALILGKNSPEWFIAEVGSIMAGGLAVVINPLCTASVCVDVAQRTDTQVILLQDRAQLRKVLQVQRKLPHVKAIVQWEGDKEETHPRLYTWEELILLGMEVPDSKLDDVIASQKPNQCCAVFYTEDNPRGVMLSHDNLTWVSQTTCKLLNLNKHDVVISYLPLNQVSVQLFDLWIPLCCGGTTYFAEADALKKSLLPTLREVRPTRFLGLPWFWEKIQTRWMTLEEKTKLFPRKILGWGRGVGLRKYQKEGSGLEIPGCRTRITEPLTEATGELGLWGRHVFMGYLDMEKETQAALDDEGYLLTSDLGTRDSSGFLYVTEWGAGAYERPMSHGGTQHRWSSEGLYMEI